MIKTFRSTFVHSAVVVMICMFLYNCSDDPVSNSGPEAKSINGTVNFVDTNFILSGGTYLISAFPDTLGGWPPPGPPSAYDTIHITRTNNVLNKSYNYVLRDLNPGPYVVSVGFRKITGGQSPILSVYGCDTLRFLNGMGSTCFLDPPKNAAIGSENQGVEGINMLSWADTTKKVY